MRLKSKIAIIFVLLVILPLAAGIVVSLHALSGYLSFQQYAVIRQTAEQLDDLIGLEKEDVQAIVEVLSGTRAVRQAVAERDVNRLRLLARIYQRLARADIVEFRDTDGRLLLRRERRGAELTQDVHPGPWRAPERPSVDIYPERGEVVIRATSPVFFAGKLVGSVSVAERLSREFIERYKREMGLEVAILGRNRVLYSTLKGLQLQALPLAAIESARRQSYGRTRVSGKTYTMAAYPLLGSDGRYQGALLLFQIETTFRAAVARARRAIALAGVLSLTYALGVGYVATRRLQAPIFELQQKMHQVMTGNYDVEVRVRTSDEFRDLAEGFNRMLNQIRRSREHLRIQNQRLRAFARAMQRELDVAGQVQSLLIPEEYTDDRVSVRVQYFPMLRVGGDYAYLHMSDEGVGYFIIADVSGHGVAAALLMSRVSAEVENLVRSDAPIADLISHLNRFIYENFSSTGMYVTFFCARVQFQTGWIEYGNAGHPAQWLFRARADEVVELPALNLPLGAFPAETFGEPMTKTVPFEVGDRFFLFTDGMFEVSDPEGNPLGLGRLRGILEEALRHSEEVPIEYVVNAVKKYSGGRFEDDALFVSVRFLGGPARPEPVAAAAAEAVGAEKV